MNITIISIILPYPLNSGGAQGIYNMIDVLRHSHRITFIFPAYNNNSPQALKELQRLWPEVIFRPYPYHRQLAYLPFAWSKAVRAAKLLLTPDSPRFQIERFLKPYGYCITRDFVRFIRRAIAADRPDVVQVEFYPYIQLIDHLPHDVKRLFVQHEIRWVRNARFAQNLPLTDDDRQLMERLKEEEIGCLNKYDAVIALTSVDRQAMEAAGVTTPIAESPFAIGTPVVPYGGWNGTLAFTGGFAHTPNQEGMLWFLREVAPLLRCREKLTLTIVGKGWDAAYLESHNPSHLAIDVRGFVEDLATVVHGAISIVPILSGSGMRIKILEAAALGSPMVTTTIGVEGISMDGACLVADSPAAFAQAIDQLAESDALRQQMADRAQQAFQDSYSRDRLTQRRAAIYEELTTK